jgi:hypothetical protein
MQEVAFMAVLNRGATCRLVATASLAVIRNGTPVASIDGNPVSYRINQAIDHGTTALFDVWWGNWCGSRSGTFRVRGSLGPLTTSAPYQLQPICNSTATTSRLTSVRYPARTKTDRARTPA